MKNKLTKYLSIFFAGFSLMLSINFYMDWRFEEEILDALVLKIKSACSQKNPEEAIVCAMNTAHYIEERNSEIFGDANFNSLKVKFMSPSFKPFNYGGGACGGYTLFLARVLKKMGFKEKVIELNSNGINSAHITLGIESRNKILLIDPMFNHAFKDSSGKLSDINDVAKNWNGYYSKHLPPAYKREYNYQSGWRFTNWNKLGIISGSMFKAGVFIWGKSTMNNLSLRYWFLASSKLYCVFSFLGFILFSLLIFIPLLQKRKTSLDMQQLKAPALRVVHKNLKLMEISRKISR